MKKEPKDISSLGNRKTDTKKLQCKVSVSGFNVYAISGQIVEENESGIILRYKKDNSRSIFREFFDYKNIVAIKNKGNHSIVFVRTNRALFSEVAGSYTLLKNGMVSLITNNGDSLILNTSNTSNLETTFEWIEDELFSSKGKEKEGKRQSDTTSSLDEEDDEDEKPKKKLSKEERKALLKKKRKLNK